MDADENALLDAGDTVILLKANVPNADNLDKPDYLAIQSDGLTNDILGSGLNVSVLDSDDNGVLDEMADHRYGWLN